MILVLKTAVGLDADWLLFKIVRKTGESREARELRILPSIAIAQFRGVDEGLWEVSVVRIKGDQPVGEPVTALIAVHPRKMIEANVQEVELAFPG